MKKLFCFLATILLALTACAGDSGDKNPAAPDLNRADIAAEEEPAEPAATDTAMPAPTESPEPADTSEPSVTSESSDAPALITSADEMAGVWLGTLAGETGYVSYTADGRFMVALSQDALATVPLVSGEYWFEDGRIHLRDLDNAGHWSVCDPETIGVYDVVELDDGKVAFQMVDDGCGDTGFTRGYVFGNMTQERIAAAPESSAGTPPELAAALQAITDAWVSENGAPGALLLVDAPDLNFTWQGAAGMAIPEQEEPLSPGDQFIISSMTKMITAVTVMKLVEQGDLALDDPISLYLPEEMVSRLLVLEGDSYGEIITVRQLLSHTSGLGDFSNGEDADGNGLPDFKDLVLNEPDTVWDETMVLDWAIANAPPVARPGETFNFSDTNYQLLGMIIESASGLALHDAFRQLIFEPLGMDHTYFEFRETAVPGPDGRGVSHAYYQGNLWNELDSHSYEWGSGGLVSTAADMNTFLWAWVNGDLFEDPASKEAMLEWVETPDAGVYYGFGILRFVLEEWDIPGLGEVLGHSGLFNSQAFYWPEQNMTIVGTLNTNEPQMGYIGVMIEVMTAVAENSDS